MTTSTFLSSALIFVVSLRFIHSIKAVQKKFTKQQMLWASERACSHATLSRTDRINQICGYIHLSWPKSVEYKSNCFTKFMKNFYCQIVYEKLFSSKSFYCDNSCSQHKQFNNKSSTQLHVFCVAIGFILNSMRKKHLQVTVTSSQKMTYLSYKCCFEYWARILSQVFARGLFREPETVSQTIEYEKYMKSVYVF